MLCDNCKQNEANVRYTQVINGVKKEMHLCESCSKKLGIGDMNFNIPISFSNFFGDFLNEYNDGFMPLIEKKKQIICDKCKMTYDDFINNGKFGCDNCYEVFSENIDPILKRLHGSNRYVGRKAKNNLDLKVNKNEKIVKNTDSNSNENRINSLKAELKKMIKEEKYEEAARIRDEIKNIEEQEGKKDV